MNLKKLQNNPLFDVALFAVCLFGANILWKMCVNGDESSDFVTVLGMDASRIFNAVSHYLTTRVYWVLQLFRPTVHLYEPDVVWFDSGFASRIIWGCTAIKQSFIWLIIILFARGKSLRKLWFIPFGWVMIHIFNVVRISLIDLLCEFHPTMFEFWHGFFFKYLFYFMMFLLWVWWNEKLGLIPRPTPKRKKATEEQND